jgi:hypothetical protein
VKVSAENGPITIGDPITLSSQPGIGMKATTAGMIVGTALEPLTASSSASIMVFVRSQYWAPSSAEATGGTTASGSAFSTLTNPGADGTGWDWTSIMNRIRALFASLWNINLDTGLIQTVRGVFRDIELQTGATIYDQTTGQPYCLTIQNGQTVTLAGTCEHRATTTPAPIPTSEAVGTPTPSPDVGADTTTPTPTPSDSPTPTPTTTPSDTPTQTPTSDVGATPTPAPTPSDTPTPTATPSVDQI